VSTAERFWSKVEKTDNCWIWKGSIDVDGRGRFKLGGGNRSAHRVSWMLIHGELPKGMCVCHRCDNPKCVKPAHLFLGTHLDNMRDMAEKGRRKGIAVRIGSAHGMAVINEEQAKQVKYGSFKRGELTALAKRWKINTDVIYQIRAGQNWRHV